MKGPKEVIFENRLLLSRSVFWELQLIWTPHPREGKEGWGVKGGPTKISSKWNFAHRKLSNFFPLWWRKNFYKRSVPLMCITKLHEKQRPFFVTLPYIYYVKQFGHSLHEVLCYLTNVLKVNKYFSFMTNSVTFGAHIFGTCWQL